MRTYKRGNQAQRDDMDFPEQQSTQMTTVLNTSLQLASSSVQATSADSTIESYRNPTREVFTLIPNFQVKTLMLREVKSLAQGHTAGMWQSWELYLANLCIHSALHLGGQSV